MLSNLFAGLPVTASAQENETFEAVLNTPGVRIERIVSTGQASPPYFWYCQEQSEWVTVLQGSAALRFENETQARVMHAGDYINIPALCKHRVEWTAANEITIWLAVHYGEIEEKVGGGEL
ncbi:cupin domain-containing protein [Rahnella selenatireducens]|uniref:cupin domain-containing protein n=1 Tax=Rahnella selenatireducens TaxID=3389797 RepID=UPI003967ECE7